MFWPDCAVFPSRPTRAGDPMVRFVPPCNSTRGRRTPTILPSDEIRDRVRFPAHRTRPARRHRRRAPRAGRFSCGRTDLRYARLRKQGLRSAAVDSRGAARDGVRRIRDLLAGSRRLGPQRRDARASRQSPARSSRSSPARGVELEGAARESYFFFLPFCDARIVS